MTANVLPAQVLTPCLLGSPVAPYEHGVFAQGTIWGSVPIRRYRAPKTKGAH